MAFSPTENAVRFRLEWDDKGFERSARPIYGQMDRMIEGQAHLGDAFERTNRRMTRGYEAIHNSVEENVRAVDEMEKAVNGTSEEFLKAIDGKMQNLQASFWKLSETARDLYPPPRNMGDRMERDRDTLDQMAHESSSILDRWSAVGEMLMVVGRELDAGWMRLRRNAKTAKKMGEHFVSMKDEIRLIGKGITKGMVGPMTTFLDLQYRSLQLAKDFAEKTMFASFLGAGAGATAYEFAINDVAEQGITGGFDRSEISQILAETRRAAADSGGRLGSGIGREIANEFARTGYTAEETEKGISAAADAVRYLGLSTQEATAYYDNLNRKIGLTSEQYQSTLVTIQGISKTTVLDAQELTAALEETDIILSQIAPEDRAKGLTELSAAMGSFAEIGLDTGKVKDFSRTLQFLAAPATDEGQSLLTNLSMIGLDRRQMMELGASGDFAEAADEILRAMKDHFANDPNNIKKQILPEFFGGLFDTNDVTRIVSREGATAQEILEAAMGERLTDEPETAAQLAARASKSLKNILESIGSVWEPIKLFFAKLIFKPIIALDKAWQSMSLTAQQFASALTVIVPTWLNFTFAAKIWGGLIGMITGGFSFLSKTLAKASLHLWNFFGPENPLVRWTATASSGLDKVAQGITKVSKPITVMSKGLPTLESVMKFIKAPATGLSKMASAAGRLLGVLGVVWEIAKGLGQWWTNFFDGEGGEALDTLLNTTGTFAEKTNQAFDVLMDFFAAAPTAMRFMFPPLLYISAWAEGFSENAQKVKELWTRSIHIVKGAFLILGDAISATWEKFSTWGPAAATFDWFGAKIDWMTEKLTIARDAWSGVFDWISEKISLAVAFWAEKFEGFMSAPGIKQVSDFLTSIGNFFDNNSVLRALEERGRGDDPLAGTASQRPVSVELAEDPKLVQDVAAATSTDEAFALAAKKYGLDESLIRAVAQQESSMNPNAVSPVGAQGLMQLMPATAADLGLSPGEAFDPVKNIDAGSRYLGQLMERYQGNTVNALAAYNWGMGNVDRKGFANAPAETRNYVPQVLSRQGMIEAQQPAMTTPAPPQVTVNTDLQDVVAQQKETNRKLQALVQAQMEKSRADGLRRPVQTRGHVVDAISGSDNVYGR